MKNRLLATVAATGLAVLAFGSPAQAVFIPTNSAFFTPLQNGTLTFTYEGFSAGDTNTMIFAFNGNTIFTNNTTPVGSVHNEPVTAGTTFKLTLNNISEPNTWSSDPALNSDGANHFAGATAFTDFGLGAPPFPISTNCAGSGGTCYLGWEDLPLPLADSDFNDLTFAFQFTPTPVPEPASLSLLGAALVGMSWLARRRRKAV